MRTHAREGIQRSLSSLARRSYNSYLARLNAERRLRLSGHWWNAAQFALTISLISMSIFRLTVPDHSDTNFSALLVVLAVLSLTVSIVVSFLSYGARARDMFSNYRALQAFSVDIETRVSGAVRTSARKLTELQQRYDSLLDQVENHLTVDHRLAESGSVSELPLVWIARFILPFILPLSLILSSMSLIVWVIAEVNGSH